jgi:hypothetical protein
VIHAICRCGVFEAEPPLSGTRTLKFSEATVQG